MNAYDEPDVLKKFKGYFLTKQRIVFEGAVYHVTQRAPGRELIFLEASDYLYFLKILKKTAEKSSFQVFAFALLPNHLHLLLQISKKNLSSSMKMLFETYASYFNKKYARKGHVFCGRFKASLCLDDCYLLTVSVYIHLNPLRAGLCQDVRDYRWTSVFLYLDVSKDTFVQPSRILSAVHQDFRQARELYAKLLACSIELANKPNHYDNIKKALKQISNVLKYTLGTSGQDDLSQTAIFQNKKRIRMIEDRQARRYMIEQLLANGFNRQEVMEKVRISKATYYRIMGRHCNETK